GYTTHAGNTFTGVAEQGGKVLLVTVMHPADDETHAVYKEAARLLDWGFAATGKVTPVGELVAPKSAVTGDGADTAGAGKGAEADTAATDKGGHGPDKAARAAAATDGSSGVGIALGIVGGVLVLVAGGVFLVNRRWPLPDLMRRRPRP
ncbi:D-alanyl-D-alanine carboxypeptidase, partial [Streptomyces sp. DT225]